jgi:hypothetical protein
MAAQWHLSGDYFENCNCSVVCPCLVSKNAPFTSRPTEGVCDVAFIFHIESGSFDGTTLDGLNVALAVHAPGPMADGNWLVAAYMDQRANDKQTEALGAIFTGAAGGPMAQLAPLIGKNLGAKKVPITYRVEGKKRSAEIPNILHMTVDPLPTAHPSGEHRVMFLPITGCVGTIQARTDITRQSIGQIIPDFDGSAAANLTFAPNQPRGWPRY